MNHEPTYSPPLNWTPKSPVSFINYPGGEINYSLYVKHMGINNDLALHNNKLIYYSYYYYNQLVFCFISLSNTCDFVLSPESLINTDWSVAEFDNYITGGKVFWSKENIISTNSNDHWWNDKRKYISCQNAKGIINRFIKHIDLLKEKNNMDTNKDKLDKAIEYGRKAIQLAKEAKGTNKHYVVIFAFYYDFDDPCTDKSPFFAYDGFTENTMWVSYKELINNINLHLDKNQTTKVLRERHNYISEHENILCNQNNKSNIFSPAVYTVSEFKKKFKFTE